jgi:hypothetical protein
MLLFTRLFQDSVIAQVCDRVVRSLTSAFGPRTVAVGAIRTRYEYRSETLGGEDQNVISSPHIIR